MPLRDKILRKPPFEYWDPNNLGIAIKTNPLNREDICKVFDAGHRLAYNECKSEEGLSSKWLDEIYIKRYKPKEEMITSIHELLHLVFSYDVDKVNSKCLVLTSMGYFIARDIKQKFENVIENEAQRIYKSNPKLVLEIQSLFNFPKGEVYEDPNQLKLF